MPSRSLNHWQSARSRELDELEAAHRGVGGARPGRQIKRALTMLLASQFRGFCRDLHIVVRAVGTRA